MSRDINRVLLPGEEVTIQATGDYIYCKSATMPVHIAMDQQVVEMLAGDKLREPSRFKQFRLENRSTDTVAYVTLVVGEGDYNRQIVQGELAVQPKLLTEDGTLREDSRYWLSLFVRQKPAFSKETFNFYTTIRDFGEVTAQSDPRDIQFDRVARVYVLRQQGSTVEEGTLYEYDENMEFVRSYMGAVSDGTIAFALDPDGQNLFIKGMGGQIRWGPRYTDSQDPSNGVLVSSENPDGGGWDFLETDSAYLYANEWSTIWRAPLEGARAGQPEWEKVRSGGPSGSFAVGGGRIYQVGGYDDAVVSDAATGEVLFTSGQRTHDTIAVADGYLVGLNGDNSTVSIHWADRGPVEIQLVATAEPAGCEAPAGMIARDQTNWSRTVAQVEAHPVGRFGSVRVRGELIRAALALFTGKPDAPEGYMDHVYAVKAGAGGRDEQAVRANQTFAAAGVADNFATVLPGRIDLQIDALMFNDE